MKKLSVTIISILLLSFGCNAKKHLIESQPAMEQTAPTANYSDQSTWLLGYFTRELMYRIPDCIWYLSSYDNYLPDNEIVSKLKNISTENLTIKIVMGTWCPDSRREVPRFMHVLDLWKFPADKITFIGVDNMKVSPVGEYEQLDIQRVPTFIFYKNNIEEGRIIENPLTSLEQDIINILTKE